MKRLLIFTACSNLYLRNGLRSRSNTEPDCHPAWSTIFAARHVAQSNSAVGATGELCTTEYIPTRDDRGWYVRRSVDCAD
jgi:hypothetical protein